MSRRVGPEGAIVGIDFNDAMLEVARRHQAEVARRVGHANVRFVKARIHDLRLDLDELDGWLKSHPVRASTDLVALEDAAARLRESRPAVPEGWADVVVSDCVLNLVRPDDRRQLFREIHRVLAVGGRAVVSDIVCDEDPTAAMVSDPELWSGCIAGAFQEDRLLRAFEEAGFHGIEIMDRTVQPMEDQRSLRANQRLAIDDVLTDPTRLVQG